MTSRPILQHLHLIKTPKIWCLRPIHISFNKHDRKKMFKSIRNPHATGTCICNSQNIQCRLHTNVHCAGLSSPITTNDITGGWCLKLLQFNAIGPSGCINVDGTSRGSLVVLFYNKLVHDLPWNIMLKRGYTLKETHSLCNIWHCPVIFVWHPLSGCPMTSFS